MDISVNKEIKIYWYWYISGNINSKEIGKNMDIDNDTVRYIDEEKTYSYPQFMKDPV